MGECAKVGQQANLFGLGEVKGEERILKSVSFGDQPPVNLAQAFAVADVVGHQARTAGLGSGEAVSCCGGRVMRHGFQSRPTERVQGGAGSGPLHRQGFVAFLPLRPILLK